MRCYYYWKNCKNPRPTYLRRLGTLPPDPRKKNIEKSWLRHCL